MATPALTRVVYSPEIMSREQGPDWEIHTCTRCLFVCSIGEMITKAVGTDGAQSGELNRLFQNFRPETHNKSFGGVFCHTK